MHMTSFVTTDLVHPHVYQQYISQRKTKESHLLLEDLFVYFSLLRIEAFSIDDVKLTDIVKPDPFGTSLSGNWSIEYWKLRAEYVIKKCAFSWALCAEDGDVGIGSRKGVEFWAESEVKYLNWQSSRIIFCITKTKYPEYANNF